MANFETIVKFENEAPAGVVRLVESNGFYRAYNHSAFLFHSCIASYKVTKKFIKNLDAHVVYTGFPSDKLLDRIGGREHTKTELGYDVVLKPDELPDEGKFAEWMETVPELAGVKGEFKVLPLSGNELYRSVCERLRNYPLESKSPVETMVFVSALRCELAPEGVK